MENRSMKIVVVLGRKGGITKSTVALTLAAGCARAGLRTVLVDADGQGNASQGARIKPHDAFYELLFEGKDFADVLNLVPPDFHGTGELWLLSAWNSQAGVEVHPDTPTLIYERFRSELDGWADIMIVDTSPGITHVHSGFYYTADYAVLPTLCEMPSILSLDSMFGYLRTAAANANGLSTAQVLGIIPNRVAAREKVQQINYGYIKGRYENAYPVFPMMRDLTIWRQSAQMRQSIYTLAEAKDYATRHAAGVAANEFAPVLEAVLETRHAHA